MMNDDRHEHLRPRRLDDFGGQPQVTKELRIVLEAAKQRGELCDHILFSGPPGLGKTTLAQIIAHEMQLTYVPVSGPAIEKPGDLASILSGLGARSLLFIDEIHRLPRVAEEVLYTAMEDGRLDIVVGDGVKAKAISLQLHPFVLVGATTQAGMLSAPLRDRFGYTPRLRLYDEEALASIVARTAGILQFEIDGTGAAAIAGRSRGTPRIANRLVRRVRDWAQLNGTTTVDADAVQSAAEAFGIDSKGLDQVARDILLALCDTFQRRSSGRKHARRERRRDVEHRRRSVRAILDAPAHAGTHAAGRVATLAAYEHLGLPASPQAVETAVDLPQLEFGD